eukprot:symbB.v1.2.017889.t1/scaffold1405.1/size120932/3
MPCTVARRVALRLQRRKCLGKGSTTGTGSTEAQGGCRVWSAEDLWSAATAKRRRASDGSPSSTAAVAVAAGEAVKVIVESRKTTEDLNLSVEASELLSHDWRTSFGRRSRPLPAVVAEHTTLGEVVQMMLADGGYAGVARHCGTHQCLKAFGGLCSFEDAGGRVIYQLGAKAQCGNCWLAEMDNMKPP